MEKPDEQKTVKSRSGLGFLFRLILSLGFVGVLVAGGVVAWGYKVFEAPGPSAETIRLEIAPGTSLPRIARQLQDAGVIQDANVFIWGTRYDGRHTRLKAGEYDFEPGITARAIIDKLVDHDVVTRSVTIPEGLTSVEIATILIEHPDLTGPMPELSGQGTLLPETYQYTKGASRADIVNRMTATMAALKDDLWPNRADDLPIKSWEEAVILASIVEKETGIASERAHIAGVFVNRLRKGMRLQSDPTVTFAMTRGEKPLGRNLTRADLRKPDPYNTYTSNGLPPGPICHPGRDAIAAVLNPMETQDFYFVADGTGGHAFARTLREHNRNVAKWRQFQRNQNK